MRRTTDPLDSPADTGPTLPIASGHRGSPRTPKPDSATKTLQPVLIRLRKWEDFRKARNCLTEEIPRTTRYGAGQFGACTCICPCICPAHWEPWPLRTCVLVRAVPAVPTAVPLQPRIPGVPRMGTNGSTMLEPLRQGLPPTRPLSGLRLGLLRSARPLRSGRRSTAVHQGHAGAVGAERPFRRCRPGRVRARHQRPAPRAAADAAAGVPGPARAAASDALDLAAGLRGARPQPGEPGGGRGGGFRRSRAADCSWWSRSATAGGGTRRPRLRANSRQHRNTRVRQGGLGTVPALGLRENE